MNYQYRAAQPGGKPVKGTVEAPDEYIAMQRVRAKYPVVISIQPVRGHNLLSMEIGTPKIDAKNLSVMCSQFAIILRSGIPIDNCMGIVAKQTKDKKLRQMLERSSEEVSQGAGIAASFEKNCPALPVAFLETVRAGEESGMLEHSFATLEQYFGKSYQTTQKIRQALSYPMFVLCVAVVVVMVLMIKVVPSMTSTFADLGGELPLITRIMIAGSDFMSRYAPHLAVVVLALALAARAALKTRRGKLAWNRFVLRVPVVGEILALNAAGQFANTMRALLGAGLGVSQALEVTARVVDNVYIGARIRNMVGQIEVGRRLAECMRADKTFPLPLVEMCAIGEETGELESTLSTIGAYYDSEADYATNKAIRKIEPIMLMLMAGVAGFVLFSIYVPMFSMYELI